MIFITILLYLCDNGGVWSHSDGVIELTLWKTRDPDLEHFEDLSAISFVQPWQLQSWTEQVVPNSQFSACPIMSIPSNFSLGNINYTGSQVRGQMFSRKFYLHHNISNLAYLLPSFGVSSIILSHLALCANNTHSLPHISQCVVKFKYILKYQE